MPRHFMIAVVLLVGCLWSGVMGQTNTCSTGNTNAPVVVPVGYNGIVRYAPSQSCNWAISTTAGSAVGLVFGTSTQPFSVNCTDTLKVYQGTDVSGPLIASFCGTTRPAPFYSPSNNFFVTFTSTSDPVHAIGFTTTIQPQITSQTCDASGTIDARTSDGVIAEPSGNTVGGTNTFYYGGSAGCVWTIASGTRYVTARFTKLSILTGDSVTLYDSASAGNVLGTFTNTAAVPNPNVFVSSSQGMRVEFSSDATGAAGGFIISYVVCLDGCVNCTSSAGNLIPSQCRACDEANQYAILSTTVGTVTTKSCALCPAGTFRNTANNPDTCDSCASGCATCNGTGNTQNCLSCTEAVYVRSSDYSTCVTGCPTGQWKNIYKSPMACEACAVGCSACGGPGLSKTNCTACGGGYTLNLAGDTCVANCQAKEWNNPGLMRPQCQSCNVACATCTSASALVAGGCTTCDESQGYGLSLDGKQCIRNCPDGQYMNVAGGAGSHICALCPATCSSCTSAAGLLRADCTRCSIAAGYALNAQSTACELISQCNFAGGEYLDSRSTAEYLCRSCANATCLTCNNVTTANGRPVCTNCQSDYIQPGAQNYICDPNCPKGFYKSGAGTVSDPHVCLACTTGCADCTGLGLDTLCHACDQSLVPPYGRANHDASGSCVTACQTKEFMDTIGDPTYRCMACDPNCDTCTGPTISNADCQKCSGANGWYNMVDKNNNPIVGGQCNQTCPPGQWPNAQSGHCQVCDYGCALCNNAGLAYPGICQACDEQVTYAIVKTGDQCSQCPEGQYANTDSPSRCEDCDTGCASCIAAGLQFVFECLKCDEQFGWKLDLTGDTCVDQCNNGEYINAQLANSQCTKCTFGCTVCGGPGLTLAPDTACAECDFANGYLKNADNTACVQGCPKGEYQAPGSTVCGACDVGCASCTAPGLNYNSPCQECDSDNPTTPYVLSADETICVRNCPAGQFPDHSQSPAKCTPVYCNGTTTPLNSNCTEERIAFQEVCALSCSAGYAASGLPVSTCDQAATDAVGAFVPAVPTCTPCALNEFVSADRLTCQACVQGTTQGDLNDDGSACLCNPNTYEEVANSGTCVQCPTGGNCEGGKVAPYAQNGFFQIGNTFQPCTPTDACMNGACATGFEGFMCGTCSKGYYKLNSYCEKCPDNSEYKIVLGVVAGTIICVLLVFMAQPKGGGDKSFSFAAPQIALSFVQITATFADLKFNWPPEVRALYAYFSSLNLNIELVNPECVISFTYYNKLQTQILLPIALLGLFTLLTLGFITYIWFRQRGSYTRFLARAWRAVMLFMAGYVLFLTLAYLYLAKSSFSIFSCTERSPGVFTLTDSPSDKCYTDEWYSYVPYAIFGIIFYVAGIPLILFLIFPVLRVRHGEDASQYHPMVNFYVRKYELRCWYWDLLIMLRKLAIVIFVAFIPKASTAQAVACIGVLFVACLATIATRPFDWNTHDFVECVSLVSSVLVLASGFIIQSGNLQGTSSLAVSYIVFTIAGLCLLAILFCLSVEVVAKMRSLWDELRRDSCVVTFNGHKAPVTAIAAIGNTLVSGDEKGFIKFWRKKSGRLLATVRKHSDAITRMVRVGRNLFVSASFDGYLRVWDATNLEQPCIYDVKTDLAITAMAVDGYCIATGAPDGQITLWRLHLNADQHHRGGKFIGNDSDDGAKDRRGEEYSASEPPPKRRGCARLKFFCVTQFNACCSCGRSKAPRLEEAARDDDVEVAKRGCCQRDEEAEERRQENVHSKGCLCCKRVYFDSFSHDSSVAGDAESMHWSSTSNDDGVSLEVIKKFPVHGGSVLCMTIADGFLYSGGRDHVVYKHNLHTGQRLGHWRVSNEAVLSLAVQGHVMYLGCQDTTIRSINLLTHNVRIYAGHQDGVSGVVIHKDDQGNEVLVSVSYDKFVAVWDPRPPVVRESKQALYLQTLPGHTFGVNCVLSDGAYLYTGADDTNVKKWLIRYAWNVDKDDVVVRVLRIMARKCFGKKDESDLMEMAGLAANKSLSTDESGSDRSEMSGSELDDQFEHAAERMQIPVTPELAELDSDKKRIFIRAAGKI